MPSTVTIQSLLFAHIYIITHMVWDSFCTTMLLRIYITISLTHLLTLITHERFDSLLCWDSAASSVMTSAATIRTYDRQIHSSQELTSSSYPFVLWPT